MCPNKKHVPEEALRGAVLTALRHQLFSPSEHEGDVPPWFSPLIQDVQHEFDRMHDDDHDERPALRKELEDLGKSRAGWLVTLANANAPASVRSEIERLFDAAVMRAAEIDGRLTELEAAARSSRQSVDPKEVLERLHGIAPLLKQGNPTTLAQELSRHIARVNCYADGKIQMLTLETGIFEGLAIPLSRNSRTSQDNVAPVLEPDGTQRIRPRRRGKLRVISAGSSPAPPTQLGSPGPDPTRLAGLTGLFVFKEELVSSERRCWAAAHALEVARERDSTVCTQAKLAAHFGKSLPTIRRALKLARAATMGSTDPSAPPASRNTATG
jgi:hypothetical protein